MPLKIERIECKRRKLRGEGAVYDILLKGFRIEDEDGSTWYFLPGPFGTSAQIYVELLPPIEFHDAYKLMGSWRLRKAREVKWLEEPNK